MATDFKLACVLFDLDGTLVDTAPDLLACLNQAFRQHGFATVDPVAVRPFISYGAAAMIKDCLGDSATAAEQEALLNTMLECYQNNIAEYSVFFSGMAETLAALEARGLKWGVVTNKRERFTLPLMAALQLAGRAACIVSGDTTAHPKPDAEPMLEACRRAAVQPWECVYVGDAHHDIVAGKNAQMKTLAAVYGYLKPDDRPETWGADALISAPTELLTWIDTALCY
ncbi:HAD-IA family hydrolase [Methylovulum psychrotolerans]|uniref:HAD family hydrolase n=1 Tax=Methylovulum psychrotolerans TaxID=1704499 RepID=UPI001BFFB8D7|nr:HAD-IA family hydrolase [Methylovulum psychrotolerans]MBT9098086.1 HAD-IA family hydrolase [Methylovulum psychrotolerans]